MRKSGFCIFHDAIGKREICIRENKIIAVMSDSKWTEIYAGNTIYYVSEQIEEVFEEIERTKKGKQP